MPPARSSSNHRLLALIIGLLLSGCAVPQSPTGGPRDQTPPEVVRTVPGNRATNVSTQSLRLTFSEYVEKGSLQEAVSITPPFEEALTYDWDGRSVTLEFPENLRENTTYVITLRTELQDVRGVRLNQPITVAFSTGPEINEHTLRGRIVHAADGEGVASYDVFAYVVSGDRLVDPLSVSPAYRTQTDTRGEFNLEYLPDTTLFVAGVDDQNRNYRPDPRETFAPPPRQRLTSTISAPEDSMPTFVVTRVDTTRPSVETIQTLSNRRTRLRFSEPVRLQTLQPDWLLAPTASADRVQLESVFWHPASPQEVTLLTEPLDSVQYGLRISGHVTDTSTNVIQDTIATFTPNTSPDTVTARVEEYLPPASDPPYPSAERPGLQFNQRVPIPNLSSGTTIEDSTGQTIPGEWQTVNGTEYRYYPEEAALLSGEIVLSVEPELSRTDSVVTHAIPYIDASSYGSISGTFQPANSSIQVSAYFLASGDPSSPPSYQTSADSTGEFLFERVPEGSYRLRAFIDRNSNQRWDGGRLQPYEPREPLYWNDSLRVRARWETDLDTLRVPSFRINP